MSRHKYIRIDASTPFECGMQYGEQAKKAIHHAIDDYKLLFSETSDKSWQEIGEFALSFAGIIKNTMPDLLDEVQGIAVGAGVSFSDVMVLNCRYEITKFPKAKECTTGSVLREATDGRGPYLIKNWDYRVGIIDHIVILHITEPDGTKILGVTEAGQLIRSGMNSHGVGLVANNLQSIHDRYGSGIPTCFVRRRALQSKSFAQAESLIVEHPRMVSSNVMVLSGKEGVARDYEIYPDGVDKIDPKEGILTHANHFVVQPHIHALATSPRDERLRELLSLRAGRIEVDHIKACLADHEYYPMALCRHPSDTTIRLGRRSSTVASEIYDFGREMAYICIGPPCENEYDVYVL